MQTKIVTLLFAIILVISLTGCYGKSEPISNIDICRLAIDSVLPKWKAIEKSDTLFTDLNVLQNMSFSDKEKVVAQLHTRTQNPTKLIFRKKIIEKYAVADSFYIPHGYIVEVHQFERVSPTEVTAIISILKSPTASKSYTTILKYINSKWVCESVKSKWMK